MQPDNYDDQFDDTAAPLSISRLASVIRRYLGVITLAVAAVACGYMVVAVWLLVTASRQTTVSLPFRLGFKGAESGEYPNGLKFSVSDITATPNLRDVFEANELSRFVPFEKFNRSIFVLEANRELERLRAEYQGRLADPKLTPMDRERIEREFEGKRGSISKSDYELQFVRTPAVDKIPPALVPKILENVLQTWARRAAIEKKALHFNAAVLGANILADVERDSSAPLLRMLLLRRRIDDIIANIDQIADTLPGAHLVRTPQSRSSLAEIRLMLDELVRFRLEPLIASARSAGLVGNVADTLKVLRAQLAYDERMYTAAKAREAALRETLMIYSQRANTQFGEASPPLTVAPGDSREAVMPQLSEGFLDRIVTLADRNADRDYRQSLTKDIKDASLAVIPLATSVEFDRQVIAALEAGGSAEDPAAAPKFDAQWQSLISDVRQSVARVNEIYVTASRLLYPETELFRTLGPTVTTTSRTVSPTRLALGGVLTMLIALPLILVGVFLHARLREESGDSR